MKSTLGGHLSLLVRNMCRTRRLMRFLSRGARLSCFFARRLAHARARRGFVILVPDSPDAHVRAVKRSTVPLDAVEIRVRLESFPRSKHFALYGFARAPVSPTRVRSIPPVPTLPRHALLRVRARIARLDLFALSPRREIHVVSASIDARPARRRPSRRPLANARAARSSRAPPSSPQPRTPTTRATTTSSARRPSRRRARPLLPPARASPPPPPESSFANLPRRSRGASSSHHARARRRALASSSRASSSTPLPRETSSRASTTRAALSRARSSRNSPDDAATRMTPPPTTTTRKRRIGR